MATGNFEFCRLCLRRKRSNLPVHSVNSSSLHSRVLWVFQIKLFEGDGLPTHMCNTCLDRLSVATQLKETILSVDTTLRLRGSNFHEQDQSLSVDSGIIPLLEVKMDQESGEEESKVRRSRKRRRKTKDELDEKQPDIELEKYGIKFTDQQEPTVPVKKEPIQSELESDGEEITEFTLKDVDDDEINQHEEYSFHSVLEIKEEREDMSDNENVDLDTRYTRHLQDGTEFEEDIDLTAAHKNCLESDAEYRAQLDTSAEYETHLQEIDAEFPPHISTHTEFLDTESASPAYVEHTDYPPPPSYEGSADYTPETDFLQEPELVIDEETDVQEIGPETMIPVPVLTLTEDEGTPIEKLAFQPDGVMPVALSTVFRPEGLDGAMPLTMPACYDMAPAQQQSPSDVMATHRSGDMEQVLPIAPVFKCVRQSHDGSASVPNGNEIVADMQNGSLVMEDARNSFRLSNALNGNKIVPVKERHRCERCKRWYVNFIKLSQHRCRARPLKTKKTINYVKCSLCEDVFYKLSDLNEHVRSHRHSESLQCQLCDRRFTNKTGLTKHMSLAHKQEAWASQVSQIERSGEKKDSGEGIVIVEDKQTDGPNERSILKALLAGQRVHVPTTTHNIT